MVIADAAVEKARAGFLPVLTFNGNDTRTAARGRRSSRTCSRAREPRPQPAAPQRVRLIPLYAQAKALAEAQRAQNTDDKRVLAFNAATAFFAVLSASAVVDAARAPARERAGQRRRHAGPRRRAAHELERRHARQGRPRGLRARARGRQGRARERVHPALVPAQRAGQRAPRRARTPRSPRPSSRSAPRDNARASFALDHRPDVLVDKEAAIAAHHFADEPMLRLVPTVGLQGTASGTTNTPHRDQGVEPGDARRQRSRWTIYDAGSRYADKHSRDAQAAIADLNLQQLVRERRRPGAERRRAPRARRRPSSRWRAQARDAARQNVDETAILYKPGAREGDRARGRERQPIHRRGQLRGGPVLDGGGLPQPPPGDGARPARNGAQVNADAHACRRSRARSSLALAVAGCRLLQGEPRTPAQATQGRDQAAVPGAGRAARRAPGPVQRDRARAASTRSSRCRSPRASRARSTRSAFVEGQIVKQGDTLVPIEVERYQVAVDQAKAALAKTRGRAQGGPGRARAAGGAVAAHPGLVAGEEIEQYADERREHAGRRRRRAAGAPRRAAQPARRHRARADRRRHPVAHRAGRAVPAAGRRPRDAAPARSAAPALPGDRVRRAAAQGRA